MDKIEVTQADRDAAASAWYKQWGKSHMEDRISGIYEGEADNEPIVHAFARHRLATRTDATPVAWMPIESAPKDGRSVLVWRDDWGEPVIARWACCYDFLTNAEIAESGLDDEALAKCDWFAADFMQGCRLENDTAPTHWMPFPAAPDATNTHPPATDVAALVEAAKAFAEIDLTGSGLPDDFAMNVLAIRQTLAPFTKGQNDEH